MGRIVNKDYFTRSRFDKKTKVLVEGVFDLFHFGHLQYLKDCKELGGILIVSLLSDKATKDVKGDKRPIIPQKYRAKLIAELDCVDYVFVTSKANYNEESLSTIRPNILVFPGEKKKSKLRKKLKREIERRFPETKVVFVKVDYDGQSTTTVINRILKRWNEARFS